MKVDHNALKTNQAAIITLLLIAYLFDLPWVVLFTGSIMLGGTMIGIPGFKLLYQYIVIPSGIAKPNLLTDDPDSHRFAQLVGSLFLLASSAFLFAGSLIIGWILAAVVIILAAINLFAGFCLGCFMYYQLGKIGVFKVAA